MSKYNHPKSVTSGTILRSIKFELNEALYLVYLIHLKNGDVRLESIASSAKISIVSASKFRVKLMVKIKTLQKNKQTVKAGRCNYKIISLFWVIIQNFRY